MPIAKFVNGNQRCEMFREAGIRMSPRRANKIKDELKKKHASVRLPDKNVIPLSWVYEEFSDLAYRNKRKDAPDPSK